MNGEALIKRLKTAIAIVTNAGIQRSRSVINLLKLAVHLAR